MIVGVCERIYAVKHTFMSSIICIIGIIAGEGTSAVVRLSIIVFRADQHTNSGPTCQINKTKSIMPSRADIHTNVCSIVCKAYWTYLFANRSIIEAV